jgi:hypothetical protein
MKLLAAWLVLATVSAEAQIITPRQPRSTAPGLGVRYFDSTGKLVGYLAGNSLEFPQLLFWYNGTDTLTLSLASSIYDTTLTWARVSNVIWFSEAGCSGQAFVTSDPPVVTTWRAVVAPWDSTLYIGAGGPNVVMVASNRGAVDPCQDVTPFPHPVVAINPVLNLDSLYTRPFHIGP